MKKFALGFLALAMAIATAQTALATAITGTLGVTGVNEQWDTTGITFSNPVAFARDATGDYAAALGGNAAITPTTIDSTTLTFASPDELIFTVGTSTATFTSTGPVNIALNNDEFLDLSGTGMLTLTGFDPTPGTFSFSATDSNDNFGAAGSSTFGFDITATPEVSSTPEPSSLILLGSGLAGLASIVRRKRSKTTTQTIS
jgi:hypothetical protein